MFCMLREHPQRGRAAVGWSWDASHMAWGEWLQVAWIPGLIRRQALCSLPASRVGGTPVVYDQPGSVWGRQSEEVLGGRCPEAGRGKRLKFSSSDPAQWWLSAPPHPGTALKWNNNSRSGCLSPCLRLHPTSSCLSPYRTCLRPPLGTQAQWPFLTWCGHSWTLPQASWGSVLPAAGGPLRHSPPLCVQPPSTPPYMGKQARDERWAQWGCWARQDQAPSGPWPQCLQLLSV